MQVTGYTDIERIGRGGFGTVYRAHDTAFHRRIALKVLQTPDLDAEQRQRFERECHATGAVSDHPNIVSVHGSGFTDDGQPYIAMEYMPGGSMADRLRDVGPLTWQEAIALGVKIASALAVAHDADILHRDIKPENILVSAYDEPCLGDFGIARLPGATLTRSGVITASVPYAPPEILDGHDPTPAADVWSLTATIYTLILGRPPFGGDGDAMATLIGRIASQPPASLETAGVPASVAAALERGLAKDPTERYAAAAELANALASAQVEAGVEVTAIRDRGVPVPASGDGTQTRVRTVDRSPTRRRYLVVATSLLSTLAIAGGAWALFASGGSDRPDGDEASEVRAAASESPPSDRLATTEPTPTTEVPSEEPTESDAGDTGGSGGTRRPLSGGTTTTTGDTAPSTTGGGDAPAADDDTSGPSTPATDAPEDDGGTRPTSGASSPTPTTEPASSPSVQPQANRAPTLSGGGSFNASETEAVNWSLTSQDPDGDRVTLTLTSGSLPPGLSLQGSAVKGSISRDAVSGYAPGQARSYAATITATDPDGASDSERLTWTVTNSHFAMPDYVSTMSYGDGGDGLPSVGSGIYSQTFDCRPGATDPNQQDRIVAQSVAPATTVAFGVSVRFTYWQQTC